MLSKLSRHVDVEKARLNFGSNYWYDSRRSYNAFLRAAAEAAVREHQARLKHQVGWGGGWPVRVRRVGAAAGTHSI